ncbi:antitoxin YezG family protein [Bhargavaea ginsengi]|uniref:immunity protein YezG family protein n=1 Tax=Bhargavaea ginsengi TaxID=426757 RepID=UPI002041D4BB|nr:immunity protein YezG family protein [Bhargavaea ginsengi]MCM3087669.1 antitoxin YezG family protein [Bhargavaea ginsengi]
MARKTEEIYQALANQLNDLIPEQWEKVFLYVEDWNDSSTAYFFYYPAEGTGPVLSHDTPERFDMDPDDFEIKEYELGETGLSLQRGFREDGQEPWTSFTFILEQNGQFKVDFGYEDLSEVDPGEQREAWKARYGIE